MRPLLGMGLLSTAVLLLQVALTRIFSVAQFYHFAFLIVSLALLGFGASGSLLAVFSRLRTKQLGVWYALGFALSTVGSYLFVNQAPFDSYSIAWDGSQAFLLIGNLLGLAVPFVFAGALIALLLSESTEDAGIIYGANLVGSAFGAMSAPLLIAEMGSERTVLLCTVLGSASGIILAQKQRYALALSSISFAAGILLVYILPAAFEVQSSEYKRLNQFRLNPDAEIVATHENAYSRLDIIESSTIHSAPGLSLLYIGELPPQAGLLIDGDNLLAVPDVTRTSDALADALPTAVVYAVRPDANVLILGSDGGMDAWAATASGASAVKVVEPNRLVYNALVNDFRARLALEENDVITLENEQIRTFAQRNQARYDVVQVGLTDNYRPIASGAFSLTENYTLTTEAFESYLERAGDDGLLVLTRWLQSPPSESLRILALIVTALDADDPLAHLVVFRSFQTATFIVKPTPFTEEEVERLLQEIEARRYDLVLAPDMPPDMINQYARLETPIYHDTFLELVQAEDRAAFYDRYEFRTTPPSDNQPFFFHFFRWGQTSDVINNLGRRWQPFGGSGYFVLVALLGFALIMALIFILLPFALRRRFRAGLVSFGRGRSSRVLGYFTTIGLSYLLIEVSLIQQFMLILGQPTLAIAMVIGTLLFLSGLGSSFSKNFPWRITMIVLVVVIALVPTVTALSTPLLLRFPLLVRILAVALLIAPLGFLMGMPFARGITALSNTTDIVPWAWAVNGSASVISAVLAVMLALSLGFAQVLYIGGGLYLLAAALAEYDDDAATLPA